LSTTTALALTSLQDRALHPIDLDRRDLRPDDVRVRVDYCGVCHSDIHAIDAATEPDLPFVPGHEFAGTVLEVGTSVTRFALGAVGEAGPHQLHPHRPFDLGEHVIQGFVTQLVAVEFHKRTLANL